MVRISIALYLAAGWAAAFDATSIATAKLRAASGDAVPCALAGAITLRLGASEFYLQDASSGVRVVADAAVFRDGERIALEGWMYIADSGELQVRARRVWQTAEGVPPQPRLVPLDTALTGEFQGQLIGVRGTVLEVRFAADFDIVSIQAGRSSLRLFYPANPGGRSVFEELYPGMQVAASGISVPQTVDPEFDGSQLRLRAPEDLAIRSGRVQPPRQVAPGLAALALTAAVFGMWTLRLRHRRAPSDSPIRSQVQ